MGAPNKLQGGGGRWKKIEKWIKDILKENEVDVDVLKGHSTRSVSTSKACLSGISVDDILSQGSWSNKSTCQKFYHNKCFQMSNFFSKGY